MFKETLDRVVSPCCMARLAYQNATNLKCEKCEALFPVLAGVAILVRNLEEYFYFHAKGISKYVKREAIPKAYRDAYAEGLAEIKPEHIEEDLESERVNALYAMNHYLRAADLPTAGSMLIHSLIQKHWDQNPLERTAKDVIARGEKNELQVLELGSGVGGLGAKLSGRVKNYLGIDFSFASVATARSLALGVNPQSKLQIPGDLIHGALSEWITLPKPKPSLTVDFVVGEIDALPVKKNHWDCVVALNVIDMMDEPADLPKLQAELLATRGIAIQSSPYVWGSIPAGKLRKKFKTGDSAEAITKLYEKAGFKIEVRETELPWLFFKNFRQLEVYSVDYLVAEKARN